MAADAVSWVIFVLIGFFLYPDPIPKVNGRILHTETSAHRIQVVDNDPEFLVGVRGLDTPLCFHLESPKNDVVRLLQDPVSGILVNARVFHDRQRNKSYLGSVFLRGEDIQILAKQEIVIVNDQRHEWLGMTELFVTENRVIVGANMVAVTFKNMNITLVIRRHFVTRGKDTARIDEMNIGEESAGEEKENGDDTIVSYNDGKGESPPVVALRKRRNTMEDSILYRTLSTNVNGFKTSSNLKDMKQASIADVSQDSAVHLLNKRSVLSGERTDVNKRSVLSGERTDVNKRSVLSGERTDVNKRSVLSGERTDVNKRSVLSGERTDVNKRSVLSGERTDVNKRREKRHQSSHFRPDADRLHGITSNGRQPHARSHSHAHEHSETVYMGVYISDSRDFSQNTHGLLGQFLYKNVSLETLNVKNGKMKARLLINQDPSRRTIALLSLRTNAALNTTGSCWRVRHQGNDVIDGSYKDYVLPSLRYNLMMKLPPHAPL